MFFGGRQEQPNPKKSPIKNQAEGQPACPIILAANWRITADLLAETMEIANAYGLGVLRAIRECDDSAILENFRCFNAAARCAPQCAEELRNTVHLLERGERNESRRNFITHSR